MAGAAAALRCLLHLLADITWSDVKQSTFKRRVKSTGPTFFLLACTCATFVTCQVTVPSSFACSDSSHN